MPPTQSNAPRLAASVILLRPGDGSPQVYMLRRAAGSRFAPDAYVFPGGTVSAGDRSPRLRARIEGLGAQRSAEFRAVVPPELPSGEAPIDGDDADALLAAALRELFEESGVLLARTREGRAIDARHLPAHRDALSFADLLERNDWLADAHALALFSHWITPESEPRRYNTHFFLAAAPAGQSARADAVETHDGMWVAPAEALARHRAGSFHLVYPTVKHLERLAPLRSVDDAQAFARRKPIVTIVPNVSHERGFTMPGTLESAW